MCHNKLRWIDRESNQHFLHPELLKLVDAPLDEPTKPDYHVTKLTCLS